MKWKKIGQIFDPTTYNDGINREWMKSFAQCTSTLLFDDFVRVYFSCRPEKNEDGQSSSYTTFLDLDRKDLTKIIQVSDKPVLPLGGLGDFDENAVYPTSVIKDDNKVLLYYAGWSRCKTVPFNTAIGMAISYDNGETFNRIGKGPILGATIDEPFVISGPKIRKFNNKWYLFYLAGKKWIPTESKPEIVYKLRMATSEDGVNWIKHNKDIVQNLLEEDECQAGPDVFYMNGRYHMYFVYRYSLDFRTNKNRGYKIGYAYSDDLYNWKRDDENVGIYLSDDGWDSKMHHYPHIFQLDEKYYMIYNGNDFGKNGFGIAILENEI